MTAEIITIGTELLLGDIVDTNSRAIARRLREAGIDLYRTTSVGDNPPRSPRPPPPPPGGGGGVRSGIGVPRRSVAGNPGALLPLRPHAHGKQSASGFSPGGPPPDSQSGRDGAGVHARTWGLGADRAPGSPGRDELAPRVRGHAVSGAPSRPRDAPARAHRSRRRRRGVVG